MKLFNKTTGEMRSYLTVILVTAITVVFTFSLNAQNIGIGTNTPDASAKLDVVSTDKGILIPRMTKVQRDAIPSPATGLMIFQIDIDPGFYYYDGNGWEEVSGGGAKRINDLIDGRSDNDGSNNFSSLFLGYEAGYNDNQNNNKNVGVGYQSLYNNIDGAINTATGYRALYSNMNGSGNIASGYQALYTNNEGEFNTAVGCFSLYSNTNGSRNIAIGTAALYENTQYSYLIAIGDSALYNNFAPNNVAIGTKALYSNSTGYSNIAIGKNALFTNDMGIRNVAIGEDALYYNTTADLNTAGGFSALHKNTTGQKNTAWGAQALLNNSTGRFNTAVGSGALYGNETGEYNTAIGLSAFSDSGYPDNYNNSTALGCGTDITDSNQVRLGNSSVNSIGGYANWSNVSDGRFKIEVKENVPGMALVKKLRPITYHLDMDALARFLHTPDSLRLEESEKIKAAEVQIGFIAQEVEAAAQELNFDFHAVDKPNNPNGHYGLRYAEFVPVLVKALQEQSQIIDNQQQLINELKERIEKLENNNK